MKITKSRLKQIIKEEVNRAVKRGHILREGMEDYAEMHPRTAAALYQALQDPALFKVIEQGNPEIAELAGSAETADEFFNMLTGITVGATVGPHKSSRARHAAEKTADMAGATFSGM